MRNGPKLSAVALVVLEVVICLAIYFGCLYIRRRRELRQNHDEESSGLAGPDPDPGAVILILPYSALKGLLTPNTLQCAACLKKFNDDDHEEAETLRCMVSKCGHVFHPTCVGNGCGVFGRCPGCGAGLGQEREGEVVVQVEERTCVVRLPEDVRRKVTVQRGLGVAITGQPCLRTGYR